MRKKELTVTLGPGRRIGGRTLLPIVVSVIGLISATTSPAVAQITTVSAEGSGDHLHEGVPTYGEEPFCAAYVHHAFEGLFTHDGNVDNVPEVVVNATIESGGDTPWGENPQGSHRDPDFCSDAPGAKIHQFSLVLEAQTPAGQLVCTSVAGGDYWRHSGSDIKFDFAKAATSCSDGTTRRVEFSLKILVCNSPIAPQTCVSKGTVFIHAP